MSFQFERFFPDVPSETEMMMLQGMTYRMTLRFLKKGLKPENLAVQAWTSQCDETCPDGQWHSIDLVYQGAEASGRHEFGATKVISGDKDFHFTFRARISDSNDWVWAHEFGVNGFAFVLPCREEDEWTLGPSYDLISGAVHLGNFIAATHASQCGFTHVLNVAETLDVVYPNGDVTYHKVFMKDGSQNPIEDEKLLDAVHWLKEHDKPENKVLLNCRAGFGRAGSTAIAYAFYTHPEMSFQDAVAYCSARRHVSAHAGLQASLERLFPRKLTFTRFTPEVPSWNYMFMLEAMTYKASVKIPPHLGVSARDLRVFAWTNQVDRHQSDGQWHRLRLTYLEADDLDKDLHSYGLSEIITGDRDFNFTFCCLTPSGETLWSHRFGEDGFAHVEPPRHYDAWTQGPDYTHILGSIHVGNFLAATNAEDCGITHVLNVADNLDMVYPSGSVQYKKVAMADGAHNPVDIVKIKEAVEWLEEHNQPRNKVLVNCRAGIGRAGSVGVAFVFARERAWSYEMCYTHVFSKRFVYPHAGLRDILYQLYPRE